MCSTVPFSHRQRSNRDSATAVPNRGRALLFVKIIYTLRKRGCQSDVLTGVRTRIYHSRKLFTSCAGTAPNVFTGVGTRLYHS